MIPTARNPARDLPGRGAGQVRLAAAGRAVEQDAAADRLAVGPVQLGMVQRVDDLHPDLFLEPAPSRRRRRTCSFGRSTSASELRRRVGPGRPDPALDHVVRSSSIVVVVVLVRRDRGFPAARRTRGRRPPGRPRPLGDTAGPPPRPPRRRTAAGRRARTPAAGRPAAWSTSSRMTTARLVLALLEEGIGQPDLERGVVGSQRQGLAELGLGQVGPTLAEQALGQMSPQRDILGREAHGLPQGLQGAIAVHRNLLGRVPPMQHETGEIMVGRHSCQCQGVARTARKRVGSASCGPGSPRLCISSGDLETTVSGARRTRRSLPSGPGRGPRCRRRSA